VAAKAPVTPPVTSAAAPMAPPVKSVRTVRIQTKATPEEIAEAVRRGWCPTDQNSSGSRLALAPVAAVAPVAAGALVAAGAPDAPRRWKSVCSFICQPLAYLAVLLSVSHMMVSQASSGRGA
jgi:hypothetical protein